MLNPDYRDMLSAFENESEAWGERDLIEIDGPELPILGRAQLITSALGRKQDLADIERLETGQ